MAKFYIIDQNTLRVGGHYHSYTKTVAKAAQTLGLDVTILSNKSADFDWQIPGVEIIPTFYKTWAEAESIWPRNWEPGNIAYDLDKALKQLPPVAEEHLFFSTIGYAELTNLIEQLSNITTNGWRGQFHLLLRYDPAPLQAEIGFYRPLFQKIMRSHKGRRQVHFYTDTANLTEKFSRMTGFEFRTLPIPFDQEPFTEQREAYTNSSRPITVSYLGDARNEKNFSLLPRAVSYLWGKYISNGRVKFRIQSNMNIPGGEPGILAAVQELQQYPPEKVSLLHEPLASKDYAEFLIGSDIVLVPYDADRYRDRSSGVLIEALATAKPVITSAGSWMASQVTNQHAIVISSGDELGPAIERMIDDYSSYSSAAEYIAPDYRFRSTGSYFINNLLGTSLAENRGNTSLARVLIVADGDNLIARNGAGITVSSQIKYLNDAGYLTCGVFIMNKQDFGPHELETWINNLRDRISDYDFEAAFIVGTGRYSFAVERQRSLRLTNRYSIAADVERASNCDAPLELINYLNGNTIDLVWVNYATNLPIVQCLGLESAPNICEMHDIQSFQKAIYGKRPVSDVDVADELRLLSAFTHLISVSATEASYLKSLIPEAKVTVTGMFPPNNLIGPAALSGARDLGEVLFACGIEQKNLEATLQTNQNDLVEIPENCYSFSMLDSIDLFYVSSMHAANVSGLKWFLDQVYIPVLAPMGISFVVAGSIVEASGWPTHELLHFIGRVVDLAPLYAAAKIVVLPITEGAGVAVKTAEALSYGRPIVASRLAVRGITAPLDGIAVADSEQEFLIAIFDLLDSPDQRKLSGKRVFNTALQMADPAHYAVKINGVLKHILGEKFRKVERAARVYDERALNHSEWGPLVIASNIVLRAWIETSAINQSSLTMLAVFDRTEIIEVLTSAAFSLIVDRTAPILRVDKQLAAKAALLAREDAEIFLTEVMTLLASIERRAPMHHREESIKFFLGDSNPVTVESYKAGVGNNIIIIEPGPVQDESGKGEGFILDSMENEALKSGGALSRFVISVPIKDNDSSYCISQIISPIDTASGAPLPQRTSIYKAVSFQPGVTHLLKFFPIFIENESAVFIELYFLPGNQATDVSCEVAGRKLPLARTEDPYFSAYRCTLSNVLPDDKMAAVELRISTSRAAELHQVLQKVVVGPTRTAERSVLLSASRLATQKQALAESASRDVTYTIRRAAGSFVDAVTAGKPLPRFVALKLKNYLENQHEMDCGGLAELVQVGDHRSDSDVSQANLLLQACNYSDDLWPKIADGEHLFTVIISSRITFELAAEFQNSDEALSSCCSVDGVILEPYWDEDCTRWWQIAGSKSTPTRWVHRVRLDSQHLAGEMKPRVTMRVLLPVAEDQVTGSSFISRRNFFPREPNLVWTGPGLVAVLIVPVSIISAGRVSVGCASLGNNLENGDISLFINGIEIESSVERGSRGIRIVGAFDADHRKLPFTEIELKHKAVLSAPGDPRSLGLALTSVELIFPVDLSG